MTIELNPEQKRAADCLDQPVLVTAGAGSGKTRMLTQRFVNAVVPGRAPGWEPAKLDQILAITFTDKAAGEIAGRVRIALSAAGLREDAREVTGAWVSTIHGLCSRILRRHSFEADVDPWFVVLDSVEAGRLRESAFQEAAGSLLAAGGPGARLLEDYDADALFKAAVSVLRELATRGMELCQLELEPGEEAHALAREVERLFERGGITCDLGYSGTSEAPREHADRCRELLGACSQLVGAELDDPELLDEIMSLLISYKPIRSLKGLEEIAAELGAAKSMLCGRVAAALVAPYAAEFKRLLEEFASAYERLKRLAGALDFDDLQVKTVALLERRPDLANRYRQQFRAVMVDEFQDTDALQLRLIELLSDNDLCTVGDEQQSIYRFRGADVDVYRAHRARMVEDGALVTEARHQLPLSPRHPRFYQRGVFFG